MQTSVPTTPSTVTTKVVVATTVALTFITFWQAAAVVLNDLASTMFYIGGITEQAIGKPAPWMVLGVMLFSYAVRSVYMESCGMFVRGGVYIVVKDSIGPTVAKLSVSSLVVDYVLTGPISAVSAGQYLGRLLNDMAETLHQNLAHRSQYFRGVLQRRRHHLFLVQQHQRRSGIQPQSSAHYADHHGDGGDHPDLGAHHADHARRRQTPAAAHAFEPPPDQRIAGMAGRNLLCQDFLRRDHGVDRPLAAGDERIRNAGAGVSRSRLSQAEEPAHHREHRVHLRGDLHRRHLAAGGDDHPGLPPAACITTT